MPRDHAYLAQEIESQRSLIFYHKEKETCLTEEVEAKKQAFEEAKKAYDEAEKKLGFHYSWLHVQRDKLDRLYREYYEAVSTTTLRSV